MTRILKLKKKTPNKMDYSYIVGKKVKYIYSGRQFGSFFFCQFLKLNV